MVVTKKRNLLHTFPKYRDQRFINRKKKINNATIQTIKK
jgi:hypothetical protein